MRCSDAAALLVELAELYEVKGDTYRARAYRRAAQGIAKLEDELADALAKGSVAKLPGVGEAILKKMEEVAQTGKLRKLEEVRAETPPELVELLRVPGVGPQRARQLYHELRIRSVADLKQAAQSGKLAGLRGFGPKRSEDILRGIAALERGPRRLALPDAQRAADELLAKLKPYAKKLEAAGSLRRRKDTIGDLDFVAVAGKTGADAVVKALTSLPGAEVLGSGERKTSVRLASGLQVDLRVVEDASLGAALLYFTGSKAHNIRIRAMASEKGWKLNEYGLFDQPEGEVEGKRLAGKSEEEVYKKLGLPWIPPELREDAGEVEEALEDALPVLVEADDLRGDLHSHTSATDGTLSPEEWVAAVAESDLDYVGLTDHSDGLPWGLSGPELVAHKAKVLELADRHAKGVRVFVGVEANVTREGGLDVPSTYLDQLDYVVAGVHAQLELPEAEQTRRLAKALRDGRIDILSHPTARRIDEGRPPIRCDTQKVFEAAAAAKVVLEVDAHPGRLDLPGELVLLAKALGCRFTVDSDSHAAPHRGLLRWGLDQARRGALTKEDVLTTRGPDEVLKELQLR